MSKKLVICQEAIRQNGDVATAKVISGNQYVDKYDARNEMVVEVFDKANDLVKIKRVVGPYINLQASVRLEQILFLVPTTVVNNNVVVVRPVREGGKIRKFEFVRKIA